jgi:ligand-binding SRPBCC domain-containing protein
MAIHTIQRTQIVRSPLRDCWLFFSNPQNLARLTPPALDFQVLSDVPEEIYPGLMIQYRVRPLFGLPLIWLTEISHVEPERSFVDEQRLGPYRLWHHEHHFRGLDEYHTEMRDRVHYILPFAPFSEFMHPWLVKPKLEQIFDYRERETQQIFNASPKGAIASASVAR